MRKILIMLVAILSSFSMFATTVPKNVSAHKGTHNETEEKLFEQAVSTIKKYETLHKPQHWPYIGYGHKVSSGDPYKKGVQLTERQAEALLRKDLRKFCDIYSNYGMDSILLGALAYNIGPGNVGKSNFMKLLKNGIRTPEVLQRAYTALCRFKGKVHKQIQTRRVTEFKSLFVE